MRAVGGHRIPVCVLAGHGINTQREMAQAFLACGGEPRITHLNDVTRSPELLDGFDIVVVPGGFSYGDHLGSGNMLAAKLSDTLTDALRRLIDRGGLLLGVCNGFQAMVRMGILPGLGGVWEQQVALVHNERGKFEDRWVTVNFDPESPCIWTRGLDRMELPVRHGEGRLIGDDALLDHLDAAHLGVARYAVEVGASAYPANPNGSYRELAGLCDPTGQVFGLMPHPEAFIDRQLHPRWRRRRVDDNDAALPLFRNAIHHIASRESR